MKHLYSPQEALAWKQRARQHLTWAGLTAGFSLAACIVLCSLVTTGSASVLLACVITISTLAGWAVILLLRFGYFPARAEAEHISGVLKGEPEEFSGMVKVSPERWHIPHSVTFLKATLTNENGARTFNVDVHMAKHLPQNGTPVRILTVRKFITAYEVQDEKD